MDVQNRLLWQAEKQVALTPKEFDVLLVLVENAGRVLTKEYLLEAVWHDTFIEEATLARNISWLRKKLAGNSDAAKLIETLPKRGYRFSSAVTETAAHAAVIVEEHTLTRIHVEETISIEDSEPPRTPSVSSSRVAALPAPDTARELRRNYRLWFAFVFGVAAAAIGFAVYRNSLPESAPKVVLLSRVAPFSGLPGRESFPAFSPDGRLLAFVWNGGTGDNFDVYIKQIGAGDPVRLTDTEADEIHPTFSPDNSHVAFVRRFAAHSEVFLVPALGGVERKICDLRQNFSRLSFSVDGKLLAVVDADADGGRRGVFVVDVATSAKRRLTTPPETATDIGAHFSPDGKSIAFVRDFDGGATELFVIESASNNLIARQLTFDKKTISGFAWSADGKRIIYASRTTALTSEMRQISIDGGASELIVTNNKNVTNPAVSADGQTLAFVEESFGTNIRQLESKIPNSTGININLAVARKLIESSRDDHSPVLSPDNRRIAFISNRTGNSEVWIADADGTRQRRITGSLHATDEQQPSSTASVSAAGSPRFSPDGKMILYDAQTNGNGDIFVVSTDGGAARRLTFEPSQEVLPSWSPDGQWIYFCSNRAGDFNLWKMPLFDGESVQVTKHGGFESMPAPDGSAIFYTKARGVAGVWRVPVEGGDETPIPELSEAGYWRYWIVTPGGVYFVARASRPPYHIKFYDFKNRTLSVTTVTDIPPIWTYPGLDVSADGERVLYSQNDRNAGTIMIAKF